MIIERLSIDSFGGIAGREFRFGPGITVILGPNEAGKSTLYHALRHLLFTPAKVHKREFDAELRRFLPLGGGETMGAALTYRHGGREYRLTKRWGGVPAVELAVDGRTAYVTDGEVSRILGDHLPAAPGTMKSVFFTAQAGLSRTPEAIEADETTRETLSDLLRKGLMEMDGISVSGFIASMEEERASAYSNWDTELDRPAKGRGIDNPWMRNRGKVLDAYYRREEARVGFEELLDLERELETVEASLKELDGRTEELDRYLENYGAYAEDATVRENLEQELLRLRDRETVLRTAYDAWPAVEREVGDTIAEIAKTEAAVADLDAELERARRHAEYGALAVRLGRLSSLAERISGARDALVSSGSPAEEVFGRIEELAEAERTMTASLDAGAVTLTLTPAEDMKVDVGKGFEPAAGHDLRKGVPFRTTAGGRVTVSHPLFRIEAVSGSGEYTEVAEALARCRGELSGLLSEYGYPDVGAARTARSERTRLEREVELAVRRYEDEGGDEAVGELEGKIVALGFTGGEVLPEVREVEGRLSGLRTVLGGLRVKAEQGSRRLDELAGVYGTREELYTRLKETGLKELSAGQRLDALAPLPEGFTDAAGLRRGIEQARRGKDEIVTRREGLLIRKSAITERIGEESAEDAELALEEASRRYDSVRKRAAEVDVILSFSREIMDEIDSRTYSPFEESVERRISAMTGGRYTGADFNGIIPSAFGRTDGLSIPYALLSQGTKDLFALALRLATAERFLDGKEGFVILDDPLVDLDPERQAAAAEALSSVNDGMQVDVLTCHRGHADLIAAVPEKTEILTLDRL